MANRFKPIPAADRYFDGGQTTAMFFLKVQIEFESRIALEAAQTKPARVLPRGGKGYLTELANGAFRIKQGQIFYNPTERQLDKIFEGELYGYC